MNGQEIDEELTKLMSNVIKRQLQKKQRLTMTGWFWYKRMLENNPLITKAITAGILMGTSDVLSQSFEHTRDGLKQDGKIHQQGEQTKPLVVTSPPVSMTTLEDYIARYDLSRSMQVAITGFTFTGPLTHTWYNLLERIVTRSIPRIPILALGVVPQLAYKMFLDAVLYSPVAVGGYFAWRTRLEGGSGSDTWEKLRIAYPEALVASWSFWPAANIM